MNMRAIISGVLSGFLLVSPALAEVKFFIPEDKEKMAGSDVSFYLFGEIDDGKIVDLQTWIDTISGDYPEVRHINLYINSPGGSLDSGWAGYWAVKNAPIPVRTINLSMVASAATLLYCAGAERSVMPGAGFLFHAVSQSMPASDYKPDAIARLGADMAMSSRALAATYKACTTLSDDEIGQILKAEYFARLVTTDDAVKIGLAQRVLDAKYPGVAAAYVMDRPSGE